MSNYKAILHQCRKWDRRAQLEFYMMFYKSVYNSCYRILGNPQEAEETMQESFLTVFRKPDLFREEALAMEKTLRRIAINKSIDIYRKRKIEFVELSDKYDSTDDSGEEEQQSEIRIEAVQQMMKLLPEGYRMVLSLHLIEEMDYTEIAGQLQLSASTVRSQYVRARQKLQQLIKTHYQHENILN